MIYRSNRGARNTGESSFESRLIDHGAELHGVESLSLWNSRNRRSYVSRISTTSDFQSSYASNPRLLIESTPQTSIFEFVSLSPIDPGERSNEHSFSARAQFPFDSVSENRDREEFMNPSRIARSILDRGLILDSFLFHFFLSFSFPLISNQKNRNRSDLKIGSFEMKMFASRVS